MGDVYALVSAAISFDWSPGKIPLLCRDLQENFGVSAGVTPPEAITDDVPAPEVASVRFGVATSER